MGDIAFMMDTPLAQIFVLLSGVALLLCVLHLAAYKPVIFLAFLFILFTLVWRTAASMYVDLAGPVLSTQTYAYVGPGFMTPLHILAYFLTLLPFYYLLRRRLIDGWLVDADLRAAPPGMLTLSDLTIIVSLLFLGFLFLDLIRHGPIPLFAAMERFVYTEKYSGAAHRWLIEYGNFVCFWCGVMFAVERLLNGRFDIRYLAFIGLLMLYMLLTGNRFSAFYSYGSFFVLPLSAVVAVEAGSSGSPRPFFWISRAFKRQHLIVIGIVFVLLAIFITVGIYNNLAHVRGYEGSEIASQFLERALVQPVELGWLSYERVFMFGQWQPDRTFDFLFQMPLDAGKNTSPQYLMLQSIGEPRTYEHISKGFQFAGGFPEIFFELFGPIYAWPFIFGAGCIAAGLTALIVKGVIQGRFASTFLSLYVLYGFYVMYIGGMLNFVTTPTYWLKISALVAALALEEWGLKRKGVSLVPWSLFRITMPDLQKLVLMGRSAKALKN
jgi:hypothetical protein